MNENEEDVYLKIADEIRQRRTASLAQQKLEESKVQARLKAESEEQDRKANYIALVWQYETLIKDSRYTPGNDGEGLNDLPIWEGMVREKWHYDEHYRRQVCKYTYLDVDGESWEDILDRIGEHQRVKITIELLEPPTYEEWVKLYLREQEERSRRY